MSIGKVHETTNQEVQECCLKPPVNESTNAVFREKLNKGLCVTTVLTRKDLTALPTRATALPWEQCVAFVRLQPILKIPRNVSNSKKKENQNQEIKGNQDQLRNHLSRKLMKMVKSIFTKLWTKFALRINNVTIGKHLQTCSSPKKNICELSDRFLFYLEYFTSQCVQGDQWLL